MTDSNPTVLVADDDGQLADLYAAWLRGEYEVRTAYGGQEAIEAMGQGIDVALVDRLMPRISGDEVLETARAEGYDCRVSIVTAVEPDFDIIDMGFDLYLTKPVSRSNLLRAIETLLSRTEYDDLLQEAAALASKRAVLKSEKPTAQLERNEAYADLLARLEDLDANIDDLSESFSTDDYRAMFRDIGEA